MELVVLFVVFLALASSGPMVSRKGKRTEESAHQNKDKSTGGIATLVKEDLLCARHQYHWHEIILGRVAVFRINGTAGSQGIWTI